MIHVPAMKASLRCCPMPTQKKDVVPETQKHKDAKKGEKQIKEGKKKALIVIKTTVNKDAVPVTLFPY